MFNGSTRSGQISKPPTIVEEEENPRKNRPPDLTGFTILDERWKDSSSDDSDDSLPVGSYISSAPAGRFCKSVDFRLLNREKKDQPTASVTQPSTPTLKNPPITPQSSAMASGGSRFKIVPVETRYKRNRWHCYDYYEHRDPFLTRVPKPPCPSPTASFKKEEIINRSSRSLSDIHPTPTVTTTTAPKTTQTIPHLPPALPKPVYIAPKAVIQSTSTSRVATGNAHTITNGSIAQANLKNGVNNPNLNGLESSFTEPRRTKSVAASPPHHPTLNIDGKIEQAMDLVKTHLMFAVREEVDSLRSKIFELENHVNRLESENTILRKTIPNDILRELQRKT